ncbi:hypothetical protein BD324DRAFT_272763 [Kockovaella imperatae]|uniref:Uncharacterized protein n=1 Tax=Kockovaella imperatae TaxID=4999 RepID=A0A1Y1US64_9TREE|nr:hypothetical protein BD324DRAFT_272763 [Kockovaella imperatae]ORX40296.1 hypothetical protein BD324DRAFT_272763 [Kockovaella imperatae]
MSHYVLDELPALADSLRAICSPVLQQLQPSPLRVTGKIPALHVPEMSRLLPPVLLETLPAYLKNAIFSEVTRRLEEMRSCQLRIFGESMSRMLSSDISRQQGHSKMDEELEKSMVCIIERVYASNVDSIRTTVATAIASFNKQPSGRKTGGFKKDALEVLEAAFSRSAVLSQRECSLVAKAAGISHQQVSQ